MSHLQQQPKDKPQRGVKIADKEDRTTARRSWRPAEDIFPRTRDPPGKRACPDHRDDELDSGQGVNGEPARQRRECQGVEPAEPAERQTLLAIRAGTNTSPYSPEPTYPKIPRMKTSKDSHAVPANSIHSTFDRGENFRIIFRKRRRSRAALQRSQENVSYRSGHVNSPPRRPRLCFVSTSPRPTDHVICCTDPLSADSHR